MDYKSESRKEVKLMNLSPCCFISQSEVPRPGNPDETGTNKRRNILISDEVQSDLEKRLHNKDTEQQKTQVQDKTKNWFKKGNKKL